MSKPAILLGCAVLIAACAHLTTAQETGGLYSKDNAKPDTPGIYGKTRNLRIAKALSLGINFKSCSDEWYNTANNKAELDRIESELMASTKPWYIDGHTCDLKCRNNEPPNCELSRIRALAVAKELINRGIPSDRLIIRHYGPRFPALPNSSESNRQTNRRVLVVESGYPGEVADTALQCK